MLRPLLLALVLRLALSTPYHAPEPLLTPLRAGLPRRPRAARAARAARTAGLTYESCSDSAACAGGRACLSPSSGFAACAPPKDDCICLLRSPPVCFLSASCAAPEVCADVPILNVSICVSPAAASARPNVVCVAAAPGGRRSLDPCASDAQCDAPRRCARLHPSNAPLPCAGANNCACLAPKIPFCTDSTKCPDAEVCSQTGFERRTFCVSEKAARAYISITKVPSPRDCPVKIPFDRPQAARAATPRARLLADPRPPRPVAPDLYPLHPLARIVGGRLVNRNLLTSLVTITTRSNTSTFCSGTLLSPNWVLTAAHCDITSKSTIKLGASSATSGGVERKVKAVHNHPKYSETSEGLQYDIAAVEIEGGALGTSTFLQVNDRPELPRPGEFVRDVGYGDNSFKDMFLDPNPKTLRQVDVPAVGPGDCSKAYNKIMAPVSSTRQLCAGYLRGNCGSCQGDSGGPLLRYTRSAGGKATPVIMGVVSFGVKCARPGFPTVYTRVSAFRRWLKNTGAVFFTSAGVEGNTNCQAGQFLFTFREGIKFCKNCPPNQFSAGGSVTKCENCPAGFLRNRADGRTCNCSTAGKGQIGGMCKRCPPGQFSPAGDSTCKQCPPGTFASSPGSKECKQCPKTFFAPTAGSADCKICTSGKTVTAKGTKCV